MNTNRVYSTVAFFAASFAALGCAEQSEPVASALEVTSGIHRSTALGALQPAQRAELCRAVASTFRQSLAKMPDWRGAACTVVGLRAGQELAEPGCALAEQNCLTEKMTLDDIEGAVNDRCQRDLPSSLYACEANVDDFEAAATELLRHTVDVAVTADGADCSSSLNQLIPERSSAFAHLRDVCPAAMSDVEEPASWAASELGLSKAGCESTDGAPLICSSGWYVHRARQVVARVAGASRVNALVLDGAGETGELGLTENPDQPGEWIDVRFNDSTLSPWQAEPFDPAYQIQALVILAYDSEGNLADCFATGSAAASLTEGLRMTCRQFE